MITEQIGHIFWKRSSRSPLIHSRLMLLLVALLISTGLFAKPSSDPAIAVTRFVIDDRAHITDVPELETTLTHGLIYQLRSLGLTQVIDGSDFFFDAVAAKQSRLKPETVVNLASRLQSQLILVGQIRSAKVVDYRWANTQLVRQSERVLDLQVQLFDGFDGRFIAAIEHKESIQGHHLRRNPSHLSPLGQPENNPFDQLQGAVLKKLALKIKDAVSCTALRARIIKVGQNDDIYVDIGGENRIHVGDKVRLLKRSRMESGDLPRRYFARYLVATEVSAVFSDFSVLRYPSSELVQELLPGDWVEWDFDAASCRKIDAPKPSLLDTLLSSPSKQSTPTKKRH